MRKRVLNTSVPSRIDPDVDWLPLDQIASVEVTSEDASHPIEDALIPAASSMRGTDSGWRASQAGEQTIRLIFDAPQRLKRIYLEFAEHDVERSQEFVLRWAGSRQGHQEIVRQQWNFSPDGSAAEVEDYTVDLRDVSQLELVIMPDRGTGRAHASLEKLRLA